MIARPDPIFPHPRGLIAQLQGLAIRSGDQRQLAIEVVGVLGIMSRPADGRWRVGEMTLQLVDEGVPFVLGGYRSVMV